MSRIVSLTRVLVVFGCFLLVGDVGRAHAQSVCPALKLIADNATVNPCSAETGTPVQNGVNVKAAVGTEGVACRGCSATVSCYAAQDQTNQYHNLLIFTIDTTEDLHGTQFTWSPAYGPGTYYLNCQIVYYNNPSEPGPFWTQLLTIVVE